MSSLSLERDATTTVFGVVTLLYAVGGLSGLLGGAQLARGSGALSSTFAVGALVALVGAGLSRRAATGFHSSS